MSYYNNGELIEALSQYPKEYPVMVECDHGQHPEEVYSVQILYRIIGGAEEDVFCLDDMEIQTKSGEKFTPIIMIN
ncbi:hypothetical protein b3_0077 [Synechococcus phage B3]|nr:hypothetical protein b3_0077 [Synechococcus phage B3]QGT54691.1 hypothetical protein b23_0076 [Synechococcus phage B23]